MGVYHIMNNEVIEENTLDVRRKEELINAFDSANTIITKNYLRILSELSIVEPSNDLIENDIVKNSRFIKLNKLVYNNDEDSRNKLTSVLSSVYLSRGTISVIIKSDGERIDYYLGIVNKNKDADVTLQLDVLEGTFSSNFQGSFTKNQSNDDIRGLVEDIFLDEDEKPIITSISGVAALRLNEGEKDENFIQGLEKVVDSVKGKSYTLVLIADPIESKEIQNLRISYENIYSELLPFMKTELSFNESDAETITEGITTGITKSISDSISYTENTSESNGWSKGISQSSNKSTIAIIPNFIKSGSSNSESNSNNYNRTTSNGKTTQNSNTHSDSEQKNNSRSEAITRGRNIQISYENRSVKTLLEKIDKQIERLSICDDLGSFNFAAYVISDDPSVNKIVASSYNGLMRGEDSSVETSYINTWYDAYSSKMLCKYLKQLTHPVFKLKLSDNEKVNVTPASVVNSKELAIQLALPKKSIVGLPVIKSVEFGRNIFYLSSEDKKRDINLGKIYHMGSVENTKVNLDKKSLAMHTFITGSTGTGKSNTIYKMLNELNNKGVNFLVVEPAKGEYKHIFGHRNDVNVFGTNPYQTKLLKINPFKFSKTIHVLEHIDRLIEIFNVCWPMYAAMPAVLKEAVEKSYEDAGWDLDRSINIYNESLYPTFNDVLINLSSVINNSAFSDELKGNYIGSLVTRVKSLTNGINGRIFSGDELDNEILFNSNTIIDLSRVGAMETKAMIMGIIIMRLQEFRMNEGGMNKELKHVTVLEEAHNIFKRTSTEQSSEGSNLTGKSVEMIANSIAEMRTYGEGFIIADQSPGMIDMSAIRNTNTKIILRLPEYEDRRLVGKAAGLSDEQIEEISKLETGVATVYQNNWIEAVLCKIDKFDTEEIEFIEKEEFKDDDLILKNKLSKILLANHVSERVDYKIDDIIKEVIASKYNSQLKINIIKALNSLEKNELKDVSKIILSLYGNNEAFRKAQNSENFEEWNKNVLENIDKDIFDLNENYRNAILQCLLREEAQENKELEQFYFDWTDYMRGKIQ